MNLRELIGVLGHELRTPLAAILGYQELLTDGIYGELDEKKREPLQRIQISAHQLLNLIDGLQELAAPSSVDDQELVPTTTTDLLRQIEESLRPMAQNRGVTLDVVMEPAVKLEQFSEQRFLRAADLAGGAAIKNSSGRTLQISVRKLNGSAVLEIARSGLVPGTDDPGPVFEAQGETHSLSAARLRLAMAAATLAVANGTVRLEPRPDGASLLLQLPARFQTD